MEIAELYKLYTEHPVVTTDSRDCPKGSIFFALKGESFDGNKFALSALEKGCAYAVVDEAEYATDRRCLLVDDVLTTFKELAREHRRHFTLPVVGITGTNGKTTTKELVSAVLGEKYKVMFTQGNFNNDVGVPKTLFRLQPDDEIAVVEMGASHPGDIKKLVEYVEPTCGMITNVGRAHLQGFGSFEGVKKTKGELYDFLTDNDGLVFINADNEHLMEMAAERHIDRMVCYGNDEQCDVWGEVVSCAPFLKFRWRTEAQDWHEVQTHLIGSYNIDNMLAAISIGLHFDVNPQQVDHALENYLPSNNRSQLDVTEKNHLVVDAYNANPSSMAAAIENFRLMDVPSKMAILGQMGELGAVSHEEHLKVVAQLQAAGLSNVWLVGKEFADIDCPYRKFNDVEEVKAAIREEQPANHYILIKGSNSVKLYELPELL
ncbi:MAG: UDP-N-acetylmuramoyl-tripeptide--D-alanyl-D-alanine ligase [Prevotella sp.]|nr:UDP-N-acetylmuramoyl-tripeptide--D-alanyl-D-alanine ligase [Prevotella sp.]MDD7045522.1 UDP-N-acetylmuramoyl-tripeptide--D-alanyl-D-alanine ligase [Prevotella sp.]MDY5547212.1 UDP-N-acetylmuramoyl-tripeptide--D-alanyl-D-alanine ligase [Prevotella sp.]